MSDATAGGARAFQVTVTGPDRPGIAARLLGCLADADAHLVDVEQIRLHGRLLLSVEVTLPGGPGAPGAGALRELATSALADLLAGPEDPTGGLQIVVVALDAERAVEEPGSGTRHLVTVLGPDLGAELFAGVCSTITSCGGNIERIVRLSTYPVTSYELVVAGSDPVRLRGALGTEAARRSVDVAVQRAGLHRRAKHLIVLDADSTLLQGEVIDMLAERAGCAAEIASVTERAMAGELEFRDSLERRLALLAGTDVGVLDDVGASLVPTPGARTLVRTLKRLGYETAVVSGGFGRVLRPIAASLGIDHVAANELEIVDGRLTGRLVGPVIDRAGKAAALLALAERAGVPVAQTIAVGDGANDLDMLAAAGLGIAFNARPVVRDAADAALNVPYLDAILFLLGISREEVETADEEA